MCGHSSVVERNLAKVDVARSNRVARLKVTNLFLVVSRACHQSAIPNSNGINRDRKTLTYRKL